MRKLTEDDLKRAIYGAPDNADEPREALAVRSVMHGDVETIEVASDFASLGPTEELQREAPAPSIWCRLCRALLP